MTRKEWAAMKSKYAEQDRRARWRRVGLIVLAFAALALAVALSGSARPMTRQREEHGVRRILNGNDE